jgi:preprotein translocase subunit YajC
MFNSLILFAQALPEAVKDATDKATEKGPQGIGDFLQNPMFLLMILMAVFFFVVVLPGQRRRAKEQEQLLTGMKKNDEVVTASGIIGTVYNIKEGGDEVVLKIDDNARIRVLKSSIVRIIKKDESAAAPAAAPTTPGTNAKPNA